MLNKRKQVLIGLMSLACVSAQARTTSLLVANDSHVAPIIKNLQDQGFKAPQNSTCPAQARTVKITADDSKNLKISCLEGAAGTRAHAIALRGSAQGDPNEFEGTATGDPNEFEGTATGDPNEFEGSATGDPNEFEGTATGDPNEFEGSATGGGQTRSVTVSLFGKLEAAARSAHTKFYQLVVGE